MKIKYYERNYNVKRKILLFKAGFYLNRLHEKLTEGARSRLPRVLETAAFITTTGCLIKKP